MAGISLRKPGYCLDIVGIASLFCLAMVSAATDDTVKTLEMDKADKTTKDCVILLHGLARTSRAMTRIANTLEDRYKVINVDYPSREMPIEALADKVISEALAKIKNQCDGEKQIHFVTHSMGGILVRQYLHSHKIENLGRTVMLGPPNKGSELADFLADNILYEFYNGPAGQQLGTGDNSIPIKLGQVSFELGVIAGDRNFNPAVTKLAGGAHDGKVSVDSSKVEGMSDHIVMPVTHTFMMMNRDVIKQVEYFLENGEFKHDDS